MVIILSVFSITFYTIILPAGAEGKKKSREKDW